MSNFYILRPSNTYGFFYDTLFVESSGLVFKPTKFWSDANTFSLDEVNEIKKVLFHDGFDMIDESSIYNKNGLII